MILRGEYKVLFDVTCDSFNQSNVDFTIKITMQLNNMPHPLLVCPKPGACQSMVAVCRMHEWP